MGEPMDSNAVNKLIAAEREKEKRVADAFKKKDEIVRKAEEKAKQMVEDAEEEAVRKENELIAGAKKDVDRKEKQAAAAFDQQIASINALKPGRDLAKKALKKFVDDLYV